MDAWGVAKAIEEAIEQAVKQAYSDGFRAGVNYRGEGTTNWTVKMLHDCEDAAVLYVLARTEERQR